jgi:acetylglutamate kinase
MKDVGQHGAGVVALKQALPYLRMFQGKTFVVKAGGGALENEAALRSLVEQVGALHQLGIRLVLVHGGGTQSSELLRALGSEPKFVAGRRVTDDAALRVVTMVLNGTVSTRLLSAFRAARLPAIGLSGVDAGLLRAQRRPPVTIEGHEVDYGHVGDLVGADATVIERLHAAGFLPVVSPLAADDNCSTSTPTAPRRRWRSRSAPRSWFYSPTRREFSRIPPTRARCCRPPTCPAYVGCAKPALCGMAWCPKPTRSKPPSAAACRVPTSSRIARPTACSPRSSPTRVAAP